MDRYLSFRTCDYCRANLIADDGRLVAKKGLDGQLYCDETCASAIYLRPVEQWPSVKPFR